jgi:hypothetical protein
MTSHLDGNILSGTLAEFLVPDATMIEGRCGGCGHIAPLANQSCIRTLRGWSYAATRAAMCWRRSSTPVNDSSSALRADRVRDEEGSG